MSKTKTICLIASAAILGLSACNGATKKSSNNITSNSNISTISGNSNSSTSSVELVEPVEVTFKADNREDVKVTVNKGNYTLPECMFVAPSYKPFKCWLVNDQEKQPGQVINVTGPMIITAVFNEAQYKNDLNYAVEGLMDVWKTQENYMGPYTIKETALAGETVETATVQRERESGADYSLGKSYETDGNSNEFFFKSDKADWIYLNCFTTNGSSEATCQYVDETTFLGDAYSDKYPSSRLAFELDIYLNHHDLFDKYIAFCRDTNNTPTASSTSPCESYEMSIDGRKLDNENKYLLSIEYIEITSYQDTKYKFVDTYEFTFDYERIYKWKSTLAMTYKKGNEDYKPRYTTINIYDFEYTFNETLCNQLISSLSNEAIASANYTYSSVPIYYKGEEIGALRDEIFKEVTLDEIAENLRISDPAAKISKVSYNKDLSEPITDKVKIRGKNGPLYVDFTFTNGAALLLEKFSCYYAQPALPDKTYSRELIDLFTYKDIMANTTIKVVKPVKGERIPLTSYFTGLNLISLKVNGVENKNAFFGDQITNFYIVEGLVENYRNCQGGSKNPYTIASRVYQSSSMTVFNLTGLNEGFPRMFAFKKSDLTTFNSAKVYLGNKYYYKDETVNKSDLTPCMDTNYKITYYYGEYLTGVNSLADIPADYNDTIYVEVSYGEGFYTINPKLALRKTGQACAYLVIE